MIHIVPVKGKSWDWNNTHYLGDDYGKGIAEKYNNGIEKFILNSNEEFACLRHDDCHLRENEIAMEQKLRAVSHNNVGVWGLIGTIQLEESCTWWTPNRKNNGSGAIVQGFPDGNENPMADHLGVHDYLATLDGCCLFFPKWIFEKGLRFDENLKGYHFYDADICCQVLKMGYKVSTINIEARHDSVGELPADFDEYRKVFHDKWAKIIDSFPISRITKFKD